ncbi:hypothetical protein H7347_00775 [Corynebacterium sp. zg-331]|uniref:maltokinase N-terminal cap-like domain-containing protein n=1 Tax=unclassified Corynebacterium TaxID=2624378 RepID=UPI00128D81BB|nr:MULTISPECIES: hypothetical protein [unclassified Corynebacterium]MBC3185127.1 hypothetical protein [Corynebacterium sp. zg-331]MPV51625.1 hypothetical protein [Corynebacterium sp. zg331]
MSAKNAHVAEVYTQARLDPGKEFFHRRFLEREGKINPDDNPVVLASWRLLDPEGRVGMEVAVLEVAGSLVQVPLTYRPEPLPDSAGLLGEMSHSVLGTRYIYDARRDPAFRAALAALVASGGQPVAKQDLDAGTLLPPQVEFRGVVEGGQPVEVLVVPEEDRGAVDPGVVVGTWGVVQRRSAVLIRSQVPR